MEGLQLAATRAGRQQGALARALFVLAASMLACGGEAVLAPPAPADACVGPERWEQIAGVPAEAPRLGAASVWDGERLLLVGGEILDESGEYQPALQAAGYEPATGRWFLFQGEGAPWPRFFSGAAWVASRLVVLGGYKDGKDTAPFGAFYDFATDRWTTMATEGYPLASTPGANALVSLGDRVLLVGSRCEDQCVQVGGLFDPLANQWTPITESGAPEARAFCSAVWTGSELFVWGGAREKDWVTIASGGAYDLHADRWSPTSLDGAPEARAGHGAVWIGSRMLVWGGSPAAAQGGYGLATGGLYDPATDTWSPTTTAGAPEARILPKLLWTGRHVIVAGGRAEGALGAAIYDPEADRWLPTSGDGAPLAIYSDYPHAAWDGCRVSLWGVYCVAPCEEDQPERYRYEAWAYYPPPEVRAAADAAQAAKPLP
ncbi:MAG: hypothetical protein HY744_03800 [Deltaproteobacteria bacterium]|nr:hypothetical protein [Deltaproteobacteria bacterium]